METMERRVAQRSGIRPFRENDVSAADGLDPVCVSLNPAGRGGHERAVGLFEGRQLAAALRQVLGSKAGPSAHLSGEPQHTVFVVAEQQGSDTGSRTARVGKATYHELLPLDAFALQPTIVSARSIGLVAALGDDALGSERARAFQQHAPCNLEML